MKNYLIKFSAFISAFILCSEIKSQQGLKISLRTDYEQAKKVLHNEPVIFTVTAANKKAQSDIFWNNAADRRITQIDNLVKEGKMKQEDADKEKQELQKGKRSSTEITLGTAASPWALQLKWTAKNTQTNELIKLPLKQMTNPATEGIAVLKANNHALAYFGISPEDMANITPGNYEITVQLNDITDKISLQIQRESLTETAMDEAMLQKHGQFYWYMNNSKKTMSYAETIIKKYPAASSGYSLKGDAQVMASQFLPALESYTEAVKLYYKQYGDAAEAPEYLLSMIGTVKAKLGDVKN